MLIMLVIVFQTYNFTNIQAFSDIKPGDFYEKITVYRLNRTYLLHVPIGYDKNKSYPLVFCLHDGFGDLKTQPKKTNFSQFADKEGFFKVYPDAYQSKHRQVK